MCLSDKRLRKEPFLFVLCRRSTPFLFCQFWSSSKQKWRNSSDDLISESSDQILSGYRNYPDNMQVGYDEGLLSADGETLIPLRMHRVQGTGALRFAVYLEFYDPHRPLRWQPHRPGLSGSGSKGGMALPTRAQSVSFGKCRSKDWFSLLPMASE